MLHSTEFNFDYLNLVRIEVFANSMVFKCVFKFYLQTEEDKSSQDEGEVEKAEDDKAKVNDKKEEVKNAVNDVKSDDATTNDDATDGMFYFKF